MGLFDRPADVVAAAPGRVNLIGEHTDYNGGRVLPVPVPLATRATLALRSDRIVRAATSTLPDEAVPRLYQAGLERVTRSWVDYVQGVTHALTAAGFHVPGFDLAIDSEVPVGSGLSSSAALEVAVLRALRQAVGWSLDDLTIAQLAHAGEALFVGSPVGMMDPLVCSLGQPHTALFIEIETLAMRHIPLPESLEIAVVETGIAHANRSGEYGARRAECDRARSMLGVGRLAELTGNDLPRIEHLPSPLDRRVRHVITENARVLEAVKAIEENRPDRLGRLVRASHESLSGDFEVTGDAIDRLVEIANEHPDVFGARLVGGGFGGAVLLVCRPGQGAPAARSVVDRAAGVPGLHPRVVLPADRDGSPELGSRTA